jgi:hypothetical protein
LNADQFPAKQPKKYHLIVFRQQKDSKTAVLKPYSRAQDLTSSTPATPRTKKTHFSFRPSTTHPESTQHARLTGNDFNTLPGLSRIFQVFLPKNKKIKIYINQLLNTKKELKNDIL